MKATILIPVVFLFSSHAVMADALNDMFNEYKQNGVTSFNEQAGETLWNKQFNDNKTGEVRSCTTCHGTNLKKVGKHAKTGKPIEPMAPSVNQKSLTEVKKIKKWFKRNCKWTLGRECSTQEQADILTYLKNQ
jgi:cytochrome c553